MNKFVNIKTIPINNIFNIKKRAITFFNDRSFKSLFRSVFFLIPKKEPIILLIHIKYEQNY